jgi:hypothetical protein
MTDADKQRLSNLVNAINALDEADHPPVAALHHIEAAALREDAESLLALQETNASD